MSSPREAMLARPWAQLHPIPASAMIRVAVLLGAVPVTALIGVLSRVGQEEKAVDILTLRNTKNTNQVTLTSAAT